VLASLSEQVDLVVIDSPPVLPVSDPMVLASLVDGVVLVASAAGTDARQVVKAVDRLRQVEAPLLGTVLNRFEGRSAVDYSYGYERPSESTGAIPTSGPPEVRQGDDGDDTAPTGSPHATTT
jgi:Mrp family chromosome partitioning ATPase